MSITLVQTLAGFGLFFLGILLGIVFNRSFQGEASKNKRLEQKLAELQDNHTRYQADVSSHFMETAKLVQTLNRSYRDVHAQLAKGASKLCDEEHAEDFLALSFSAKTREDKVTKLDNEGGVYAPPMDYAPKEKPDEEGTLSEGYGLQDSDDKLEDDLKTASSNTDKPETQENKA